MHTSRVHKQSLASCLLEIDPKVCPIATTTTTTTTFFSDEMVPHQIADADELVEGLTHNTLEE